MKPRPVTCIHIAAYLFSALVLGVTAVSYYRYVNLKWSTGAQSLSAASAHGFLWLAVNYELPLAKEFIFSIDKSSGFGFPDSLDDQSRNEESHDFGMTSFSVEESYGCVNFRSRGIRCRIYMIPFYLFLIPPLTWKCGLYLYLLRRRPTRNIEPMKVPGQHSA